jgi:N-acetylglucosaminyl-diphospho-decaprenol L-rhamnosyltransferase
MKDLRIVIVSWNVEKLLDRCLRSLPDACRGLDWDVVVVDNASADGSVLVAKETGAHVIVNPDNRGFAKACNQGIAGHDARYVLLLNPDTECPSGSLTDFVRFADQEPTAGIFGPKLIYPDGKYQESVRRFPTVWNQLCILLKLHHVFPWLGTLKRYFAKDLDAAKEANVDQVMGACFLIRREVIEQIGGLDERYFIWFEEVDYCRMAREAGWTVRYLPSVTVIHHGGQSFAQVFSTRKQKMFNDSLVKYFAKWHAGWRSGLIRSVAPLSILVARLIEYVRTEHGAWLAWFSGIIAFEILSLATVFGPIPRAVATILVSAAVGFVAMRRPSLALSVMLVELMIGSKGALLKIPEGSLVDGGTSLRVCMTFAFFLGWTVNAIRYWFPRRKDLMPTVKKIARGRTAWIALAFFVTYAAVRGLLLRNAAFLQDANAWVDIALLVPVIDVASRDGQRLMRYGRDAVIAALLWLPIKTLFLLYVFSHGIKALSNDLYLWLRRTGVGEATLVTGNLFRVFIQSQVYAIGAVLVAAALFLNEKKERIATMLGIVGWLSLLLSLSRSFWIGMAAGFIVLGLLILLQGGIRGVFRSAMRSVITVIIAVLIIAATVFFPIPRVDVGSLASLFGSRGSASDAAAESRWNLLPVLVSKIKQAPILGSGFGATVTYKSKDPRILAQNPDGLYTTHAFEWGWLEHWIKFGILGIPVMLWLVASLAWRIWRTKASWSIRASFVATLAAVAALHVFTPYLNHPLGFGFLLAMEGFIASQDL